MKSTKFWVILVAVLLAVSAAGAFAVRQRTAAGTVARVYQDGELIRAIDLSRLTEGVMFTVTGPAGESVVTAEPGRICVSCADCPDQVCVHQGWISTEAVPIVCLPNKLVIRLEGAGAETEFDGVTG